MMIFVNSPHHGSGVTVVAINLAVALHKMGFQTALMDSDTIEPKVAEYLGLGKVSTACCFPEFARGKANFVKASSLSPISAMRVMPSRKVPGVKVTTEMVKSMVLRSASILHYDFIVVDASTQIVKIPDVLNPQHLVVLNPSDLFSEDTRVFFVKLSHLNKFYTRLVNRSSAATIHRLNATLVKAPDLKIDMMLPEDHIVFESIAARESAYVMSPNSKFCLAIRKVADFYKELEFGRKNEGTFKVLKELFNK